MAVMEKIKNTYSLSRKKVMKLASVMYAASKTYEASLKLMDKYYGRSLSPQGVQRLARTLSSTKTWGGVQSLAWKAAKHSVRKRVEFVESILNDPHYTGHYYTERVACTVGGPIKEEVVYTQKYGRVVLSSFELQYIPSDA